MCGHQMCHDCYDEFKATDDEQRPCTDPTDELHDAGMFLLVTKIAKEELQRVLDAIEAVLTNGATPSSHSPLSFDIPTISTPEELHRYFLEGRPTKAASHPPVVLDPNNANAYKGPALKSLGLFDKQYKGTAVNRHYKLVEWPMDAKLGELSTPHLDAFADMVPCPSYTTADGKYNLVRYLPGGGALLDLGPKLHIACGSTDELGTTPLHADAGDTVNILVSAELAGPPGSACAIWDVYRAEDASALRDYLQRIYKDAGADFIHSQSVYLDEVNRVRLRAVGVTGWRIYQGVGDAVFVPAGCPYQVAVEFCSAERIHKAIRLQDEFRKPTVGNSRRLDRLSPRSLLWALWAKQASPSASPPELDRPASVEDAMVVVDAACKFVLVDVPHFATTKVLPPTLTVKDDVVEANRPHGLFHLHHTPVPIEQWLYVINMDKAVCAIRQSNLCVKNVLLFTFAELDSPNFDSNLTDLSLFAHAGYNLDKDYPLETLIFACPVMAGLNIYQLAVCQTDGRHFHVCSLGKQTTDEEAQVTWQNQTVELVPRQPYGHDCGPHVLLHTGFLALTGFVCREHKDEHNSQPISVALRHWNHYIMMHGSRDGADALVLLAGAIQDFVVHAKVKNLFPGDKVLGIMVLIPLFRLIVVMYLGVLLLYSPARITNDVFMSTATEQHVGLVATTDIPEGTSIQDLLGQACNVSRLSVNEGELSEKFRLVELEVEGEPGLYLIIGPAGLINHSCQPNCE
ncbi:hypothetical protein HK405_002780, partial [Cladochytrium tenue]